MDIGELRRQHAEIGRATRQLAELVATQDAPTGVAAVRWHLARLLMTHLALEDRILYPALLQADGSDVRTAATKLQTETGTLAACFSLYMTQWSDDRIAREWPAFCRDTETILRALGERIDREERTLYPLAERVDTSARPRLRRA